VTSFKQILVGRCIVETRRQPRVTFDGLRAMKRRGERIAVLTGYDTEDATLLDAAGIDIILIGDSVGNVRLGYPDTTHVTMDDMAAATSSVASAEPSAMVVVDMPIHSYETPETALANANQLISLGADAVKLEGGTEVAGIVRKLTQAGLEVMGHIAHTPQTDRRHVIEGRTKSEAEGLLCDAKSLEETGVFSVVIELADSQVAGRITDAVSVPTIGIGAGPHTDGQVLVLDDLVGWTDFSKFRNGKAPTFLGSGWDRRSPEATVKQFIRKVKDGTYPSEKESYNVLHE